MLNSCNGLFVEHLRLREMTSSSSEPSMNRLFPGLLTIEDFCVVSEGNAGFGLEGFGVEGAFDEKKLDMDFCFFCDA